MFGKFCLRHNVLIQLTDLKACTSGSFVTVEAHVGVIWSNRAYLTVSVVAGWSFEAMAKQRGGGGGCVCVFTHLSQIKPHERLKMNAF